MSGWAGIVAVVVGGLMTDVVVDIGSVTGTVLEVEVDMADEIEPHATRVALAAKSMPMIRTARLIGCLAVKVSISAP